MYHYVPDSTSWISIDSNGFFDASTDGLSYLYGCEKQQCKRLSEQAIKYFKRDKLLETFIQGP